MHQCLQRCPDRPSYEPGKQGEKKGVVRCSKHLLTALAVAVAVHRHISRTQHAHSATQIDPAMDHVNIHLHTSPAPFFCIFTAATALANSRATLPGRLSGRLACDRQHANSVNGICDAVYATHSASASASTPPPRHAAASKSLHVHFALICKALPRV